MVKAQTTITLSRVNDGSPGVPGRTYFIEPSTLVLKKGQDNVISPGTVDFKAYYRDGNSASRTAYEGRFKIEETVDGTTWKTIYTSSANESSVKHSTYDYLTDAEGNVIVTTSGDGIVAAVRDIHMIRCTLYAAGGTTNALDTQSVTVVKDVKALTQEEVFNLLTNYGAVKGIWMENGQLYISFTIAKGGEMTLGGINNGNGLLKVLDSNGKVIGSWSKDGIDLENGKIKGTLIELDNNTENGVIIGKMFGKKVLEMKWDGLTINTSLAGLGDGMHLTMEPSIFRGIYLKEKESGEGYASCWVPHGFGMAYSKDLSAYSDLMNFVSSYGIAMNVKKGDSNLTYVKVSGSNIFTEYTSITPLGISTTGTKNRCVKTENYDKRLLYCYEMPSPMFGDIGEGMIDDSGICYIYLDDIFTETINTGIEYQVFLQKEGSGDLWVDSKEPTFFIVKGTPGLKFSWEIKAKQRDFEYERLEDTETTKNDVEIIDYEMQGQKIFEEYLLEKETTYECSN